jgi:hypothetical protein
MSVGLQEAATKNVKTKNGKIFFCYKCFNINTFHMRTLCISVLTLLMGLQKSQFLHGKTFYPGTSYPTNTALLILVCSLGCKFT